MRQSSKTARIAGVIVAAAVMLFPASSATAPPPGKWTQIAHAHNGARSNLGLARGKDSTLHVLWAGPNRPPYPAVYDTPVTPRGVVGKPQAVLSGWTGVNTPTAATASDGSVHAVISGQKTGSNTDPYAGLNEVVGPRSWKLGARAFGNYAITVASNADVHSAFLGNGQLVSVWQSAAALLFQSGVDPATTPQVLSPAGQNPVIAVDGRSGEAVIAYKGISTSSLYFRRILPTLGAPATIPQGEKVDAPSLAARAGGGVYSAYTPDGSRVLLLAYGGKPRPVPVPRGTRVLTAGLAAGPEGRLWIFYGNEQTTYVTRTSKRLSGFEPVQTLKSPPKTVQLFRLEGEGSAGPLDLFASVTVDGKTKDGSYHTQVQPKLSLRVTKKPAKKGATVVSVRVVDAGDAVGGAKVSGLPGGAKRADAKGVVVVTFPPGKGGRFTLMATKPGYVAARGTLSV